MAVEDHTSAYFAFNILFLHNVSEDTDVSQVAFDFPTYTTQLRWPVAGPLLGALIHRGEPYESGV